jgi:hypothetical protein
MPQFLDPLDLVGLVSSPSTPATGHLNLYARAAGSGLWTTPYSQNSLGEETPVNTLGIPAGGRLTLESNVPLSVSDQAAATTLYYVQYGTSNQLLIPNGSAALIPVSFLNADISVSLTSIVAGTVYDVYVYLNSSGTFSTVLSDWPTATARGTGSSLNAREKVRGVYTNSNTNGSMGSKKGLLLGTIAPTVNGQLNDTAAKLEVYNLYNRVYRRLKIADATSHAVNTSSAWRVWRNVAANQIAFVVGETGESAVIHMGGQLVTGASGFAAFDAGINATTSPQNETVWSVNAVNSANMRLTGSGSMLLSTLGSNFIAAIQQSSASETFSNMVLNVLVPA